MSNPTQVTIELARLPLSKVQGAFFKFHHDPTNAWAGKSSAVNWLALQIEAGTLSMDNIRTAPAASVPITGTTAAPVDISGLTASLGALAARVDDVAGVADRAIVSANSVATMSSRRADNLAIRVEDIATGLQSQLSDQTKAIEARINSLAEALKPDTSAVQYEVSKAVRDAFEPFLSAVQDAGAQAAVAKVCEAIPSGLRPASEVFGVEVHDRKGNELQVEVWNHPDAPAVDPDFIWTAEILKHLTLAERTGENLWFGGEKGTGKSETARQFAARTGRAFKRINFHKHTSAEEYVGAVGLVDGETVFQPKDFLMAYTTPSTVILLDEVTNADPGELAPLNGFLEPNAAVSFGGITHRRAPGVLVFAADNTFGNGDDTGRHVGTRLQNSALIDRFARVIPFTFLPKDKEAEAIMSRAGCSKDLAIHVLDAIGVARQKVQNAEIVDAPSIRSAIAFIRALTVLPPFEAWQTAVVARQPIESHAELNSIFVACINEAVINQNI